MKTKILSFIDFEKVDTLLEGFNKSTGFVTGILDLDGNILSKSGWRQVCTEFHRTNSETSKRCTISDTILAGQMAKGKKYHFYKCMNGLIDVAVPIVIKGEHIANLFSGQFFIEEPDEFFFKEQAKKFGLDEDSYLNALRKVPVMREEKVKDAMEFLLNMTQLISEITFQKLEQIELNEALRTSEERYRLFLENSMDAILLTSPEGSVFSANQAACTIFQQSEEEICNLGRNGLVDRYDPRLPLFLEERDRTGKAKGELLMFRKDGAKFPVEISTSIYTELNGQQRSSMIIRDITERKQTEAALRLSEEKFNKAFHNSPDAIIITTVSDGKIIDANETFFKLSGYKREFAIGYTSILLNLWNNPDDRLAYVTLLKEQGSVKEFETKFITSTGEVRDFFISGEVFTINDENCILGILRDITEHKKDKEALQKNEEKYRFMFNNNPQPNWIYDLQTLSFLEVNEAAIIHYGYSKEEFLSMTLKDIRPIEDIPSLLEDVNRTSIPFNNAGEWRHIKKNGAIIFVEIISHTVIFNGRDARHVLVHDITDRKLAEDALKQANNELEQLHNNLDEAVFTVDLIQNKVLYASKAHQNVFGQSPVEFMNNPQLWYEIILPEDKPIVDAGNAVLSSGNKLRHEYRIVLPNKQIRWIEAKMNPTLDKNGRLIRIDGVATDITHRKQIEKEYIESELNFHRSISESPVGIRIVSVKGKTIYANKAFLDIYEFNDLEEFTNTPAINRYTPESYVQHLERKKKRDDGNEVFDYEISIIGKNDEIRHIKVSRKEVLWDGIKHFQVINLDITEQRKAEEQLRKLSRAVEQSPDAICITNPQGIIEYVNPRTIVLTGFSANELINENARIFSSGEKSKEEYTQLWQTIKSGKIWIGELHNKKKTGELYWESTTISPIFDTAGQITHFLAIKEDVTERKRLNLALSHSEEQLRKFASHLQNVREEEKNALAREIHDDLGQILVALKIDTGLLKNEVVKSNTSIGSEEIIAKFDTIVTLIDKTIKTARRIMNGLRPELLEINGFVGAATSYLHEFEDRYHIICVFNSEISDSEMNSQQSLAFFRILQEALNNIAKHSKATLVKIHHRIDSNKLILEIIDNGVGFDKNISGRQDSYGMISMKERVVLLEGKLDIVSEIGKGTSVRVEIPYLIK